MKVRRSHRCLRRSLPSNCSNGYLGEKLLKVPHKDLSLLLDELLATELQVPVHILLRVDVVLLYLWCSLGATQTKGLALSSGVSLRQGAIKVHKMCVVGLTK